MKKIFNKKTLIVALIILLVGGGVSSYLFIFKKSNNNSSTQANAEFKVDSVFGYIGSEANYSKFNALVGMFDSAKYLVKNEAGLEPSLVIFAPENNAFEKSDMKAFDTLSASGRDQLKLYHIARLYPATAGASANLDLTDGQKIQTLAGKEVIVKKEANNITITDGKGRQANVSAKYASSSKGDRIYFIDSVLLFQ